jgi:hypothetical protein
MDHAVVLWNGLNAHEHRREVLLGGLADAMLGLLEGLAI